MIKVNVVRLSGVVTKRIALLLLANIVTGDTIDSIVVVRIKSISVILANVNGDVGSINDELTGIIMGGLADVSSKQRNNKNTTYKNTVPRISPIDVNIGIALVSGS